VNETGALPLCMWGGHTLSHWKRGLPFFQQYFSSCFLANSVMSRGPTPSRLSTC